MARSQTPPSRRRTGPDRLTLILGAVFGVLVIAAAVVAFIVIRNLFSSWTITDLPGAPVSANPIGTTPGAPLQAPDGPPPEPWDGNSRVTVLLMGLDYRDWEAGEIPRTDTMMLVTIDPVSMTAGMLSIPRDMWVNIPGFDYGKINTAYFLGEANKLPGGGPALAVKTVQEFLGVPINYYAQVDFYAFVRFIDEIGGIRLRPFEDITIEPMDGTQKETHLKAGEAYTLDGKLALAYARARYESQGGDVSRAQRQQQVIMAVRDRLVTWNLLPKLIAKSSILYQELSAGVRTNMNLDQVFQLAQLGINIPLDNIKKAVIGYDDAVLDMTYDGQSILRPYPERVRARRDEIFASSGPVAPYTVSSDSLELAKAEAARISIQNGTLVNGLAEKTGGYLTEKGLTIVEQTSANQAYTNTTIMVYANKPYTIKYLSALFNVPTSHIQFPQNNPGNADVVVILGTDWANDNPMP